MQEFEKWWNDNDYLCYEDDCYITQKAWIAALKWALTHKKNFEDVDTLRVFAAVPAYYISEEIKGLETSKND